MKVTLKWDAGTEAELDDVNNGNMEEKGSERFIISSF